MQPKRLSEAKQNRLLTQDNDHAKFFRHFGASVVGSGIGQLKGNCVMADCGKDSHFFASASTGLWDCKRCGRGGNALDFIRLFWEGWRDFTGEADFNQLARDRPGITLEAMYEHKLAYNRVRDEWLIPAFNREDKIGNLYTWRWQEGSSGYYKQLVASPGIAQLLFRVNAISKSPGGDDDLHTDRPLWILEGHWDALAWWAVLGGVGRDDDFGAVPGATTYPRGDIELLGGRDVILLFDNDAAGKAGIEKLLKDLAKAGVIPARLRSLVWMDGLADGFDIRDLVRDPNMEEWSDIYDFVNGSLVDIDVKSFVEQHIDTSLDDMYYQLLTAHKKMGWQLARLATMLKSRVK